MAYDTDRSVLFHGGLLMAIELTQSDVDSLSEESVGLVGACKFKPRMVCFRLRAQPVNATP